MRHLKKFESYSEHIIQNFDDNQNILSEDEKHEVENLIREHGGPFSTIEHLLENMRPGDESKTLSKIYFILSIRHLPANVRIGNFNTLEEYIRSYGLDFYYKK